MCFYFLWHQKSTWISPLLILCIKTTSGAVFFAPFYTCKTYSFFFPVGPCKQKVKFCCFLEHIIKNKNLSVVRIWDLEWSESITATHAVHTTSQSSLASTTFRCVQEPSAGRPPSSCWRRHSAFKKPTNWGSHCVKSWHFVQVYRRLIKAKLKLRFLAMCSMNVC